MKRKILSIFLICLWGFQCSFSFLLYQVERIHCHIENDSHIKNIKSSENIKTFKFSKKYNINWEIKDHEFILEGKLLIGKKVGSIQRKHFE